MPDMEWTSYNSISVVHSILLCTPAAFMAVFSQRQSFIGSLHSEFTVSTRIYLPVAQKNWLAWFG